MIIFGFRPLIVPGIALILLALTAMPGAASDSTGYARYEAIAGPLCPAFKHKLERITALGSRKSTENLTIRYFKDAFVASEIYTSDAAERCSLSSTGDTRIALLLVADHYVTDAINRSDMPIAERMETHRAVRAFFSSKGVPRRLSLLVERNKPELKRAAGSPIQL